jgi:hypothetical protein
MSNIATNRLRKSETYLIETALGVRLGLTIDLNSRILNIYSARLFSDRIYRIHTVWSVLLPEFQQLHKLQFSGSIGIGAGSR